MPSPERLSSSRTSSSTRSWIRRAAAPALAALLAGGALVLSAAPASAQTAPGTKFAVIDLRRAMLETEEGLRAKADLTKLFDRTQGELEPKQRHLLAEEEVLKREQPKDGRAPTPAFQKRAEAYLTAKNDFDRLTVEAQREMQRKEQERMGPIQQKILEAVKRIAAQDGFEVVLEKSTVPYFRADLEITDRAIQAVNMGGGASPKGAPPPAGKPAPAAPAPAAPPAKAPAAPAPKK
jgi:outer membrane protein